MPSQAPESLVKGLLPYAFTAPLLYFCSHEHLAFCSPLGMPLNAIGCLDTNLASASNQVCYLDCLSDFIHKTCANFQNVLTCPSQ